MFKPSLTQAGFMGFDGVRQHHIFQHAAFLAEGHHLRFEALATHDGLLSFTGRAQLMHDLNVRRSKELKKLLRGLGQQKIIRLTNRTRIIAIIGPDFIRTL